MSIQNVQYGKNVTLFFYIIAICITSASYLVTLQDAISCEMSDTTSSIRHLVSDRRLSLISKKNVYNVRIRFLSCQCFFLPSTGLELTPLIHCSTNRLALCPAPQTTPPHPLHKNVASIIEELPCLVRTI